MEPDTLDQLHGNSPKPVPAAEALKLTEQHFGESPKLKVKILPFATKLGYGGCFMKKGMACFACYVECTTVKSFQQAKEV